MEALQDAYGFSIRARLLDGSGLAYCEVDDAVGPRIVSLPFTDACDPLLTSADAFAELVAPLLEAGVPVHLRCRDDRVAEADPRFQVVKRARWHVVDVDRAHEEIWSDTHPSAQRAVRRARSSGVKVRPLEGEPGIADFHRLHVALRKSKYRLLAQPHAFFTALMDRFGPHEGWLPLGAYVDDVLVAATVYLRWGDVLSYKFNASSPGDLGVRPNNLLLWEGVLLAQAIGCRTLDLGPSDDDQPGLIRFKRQHGGVESEVRSLRHDPPGWSDPRGHDVSAMLGRLTRALTAPAVPDDIAAAAGDAFYRYFA